MPTTKDFEDIFRAGPGCICEALPSAEDRSAYIAWLEARSEALRAPLITCPDFKAQVGSANLINENFRTNITRSTMENPPLSVPIASDGDYLYRLMVFPYQLMAQDQNRSDRSIDGAEELIDPSILGVNLTIQPREPALPINRRKANLSEQSTRSAESDDDHAPGFIFFQLGSLQYTSAEEVAADMGDDDDAEWLDTNFCLVARLGHFGRSTGIYAIYDMFQAYGSSTHRRQIVHDHWGILPRTYNSSHTKQFSIARIGDSLESLGYGKELVLEEVVEHPVEIVRVKPAGNTLGAVRQTVDKAVTFDGQSW